MDKEKNNFTETAESFTKVGIRIPVPNAKRKEKLSAKFCENIPLFERHMHQEKKEYDYPTILAKMETMQTSAIQKAKDRFEKQLLQQRHQEMETELYRQAQIRKQQE